jgi:hypothetical protein
MVLPSKEQVPAKSKKDQKNDQEEEQHQLAEEEVE